MSATIIDGKAYAESLAGRIASAVPAFEAQTGRVPGLAVVLVGSDPASEIYVRSKGRKTVELGMASFEHILPETVSQDELLGLVAKLNADNTVDGILVQLPLPRHLDELAVIAAIDPGKDVDGLHPQSAGRLVAGISGPVSCTPLGCLMLLKNQLGDLSGLDAIVVGRSILVGKPMAQLLLNANCTVTMAHSRTRNLADKVRQADIVVAASGQAEMIKGDWIKPGATVIDVGTTRVVRDGRKKLLGDIDFASALPVAGAIYASSRRSGTDDHHDADAQYARGSPSTQQSDGAAALVTPLASVGRQLHDCPMTAGQCRGSGKEWKQKCWSFASCRNIPELKPSGSISKAASTTRPEANSTRHSSITA